MNNVLTIKATITVESSGKVIDTLADWGCAIGNNDYIGEPEVETYFIDVPGTDGFLDGSEAITGIHSIFRRRCDCSGAECKKHWINRIKGDSVWRDLHSDTGEESLSGYRSIRI